jgi:hypothetical protein
MEEGADDLGDLLQGSPDRERNVRLMLVDRYPKVNQGVQHHISGVGRRWGSWLGNGRAQGVQLV